MKMMWKEPEIHELNISQTKTQYSKSESQALQATLQTKAYEFPSGPSDN